MRSLLLTLTVLILLPFVACSRQPSYPAATLSGSNIVIDAASLEADVPKFFTYRYNGKNISYFVLKIQGKIMSFFDACASCYPHKRGYRYSPGYVTCGSCDIKFSIYQLEKGLGSCFPIKLEGKLENGKYVIPVAALVAEKDKF